MLGCGGDSLPDASVAKAWPAYSLPVRSTRSDAIAFLKTHRLGDRYLVQSDFRYYCVSDTLRKCNSSNGTRGDCFIEDPFNGGHDGLSQMYSPRTIIGFVGTPSSERGLTWCDLTLYIGFDTRERVNLRQASQMCTGP